MAIKEFSEVYAVPGEGSIIDVIDPETGLTSVYRRTEADVLERSPGAVRMSWETWQTAKAARQNGPIIWEPSTDAQYHEMLGVLPPIEWRRGAFLVGEPDDHCVVTGRPRYRAYRCIGDEYFVSSRPLTRAELRAIVGA